MIVAGPVARFEQRYSTRSPPSGSKSRHSGPQASIAIVFAVIEFLWDGWRPHYAVLGEPDEVEGYHDITRYPNAKRFDGLRTDPAGTNHAPVFVTVQVKLDPDGTLDVTYNGTNVYNNVPIGYIPIAGRFGFGSGTEEQTQAPRRRGSKSAQNRAEEEQTRQLNQQQLSAGATPTQPLLPGQGAPAQPMQPGMLITADLHPLDLPQLRHPIRRHALDQAPQIRQRPGKLGQPRQDLGLVRLQDIGDHARIAPGQSG